MPSSTHIHPSTHNSSTAHRLASREGTSGLASSSAPGGTVVHIQGSTMVAGGKILSDNINITNVNNFHGQ
jgi:hypothetical protein